MNRDVDILGLLFYPALLNTSDLSNLVATIDSRTKFVIQALRRESIATFDYRNFQHLIFKLAGEFAYDQVPLVRKALPITLSFTHFLVLWDL